MEDINFQKDLHDAYSRMLLEFPKGLSDTSTRKFDQIRKIFAKQLSIDYENNVYAIGSGTRPGNIEVRLSQGIRAYQHTQLGLTFIKAKEDKLIEQLSDSAVTTIRGFLERGKAVYDSILVLVESGKDLHVTRLVTYPDSSIKDKLAKLFEDEKHFKQIELASRGTISAEVSQKSADTRLEHEKWLIPDDPGNLSTTFAVQRLVEGCPGSGKSFLLEKESFQLDRVIRTVFHPETTHAEFLGFLSPETAFKLEDPAPTFTRSLPGLPYVFYTFSFGPLLEAYIYAVLNPKHSIVLIIEELSRAPASLVFGETLQLLDRVRKGEDGEGVPPAGYSRYEIRPKTDVQLFLDSIDAYPPYTQQGCMRFPPNLYIWATMNRADQNARQLDTAFLRRWRREHVSYDEPCSYDDVKVDYLRGHISWRDFRKKINQLLIDSGIREDKLIGPYFLGESDLADRNVVANDLLGYLWHDVLREDGQAIFPGIRTFSDLHKAWMDGSAGIDEQN